MADKSVISSTSTSQPLGVATVLVQRIKDPPLLGNVLMHFLEVSLRHDCEGNCSDACLSRATIIIFRAPAELGGEKSTTAFPIASNRASARRRNKRETNIPRPGRYLLGDLGYWSYLLSFCLLRVGALEFDIACHCFSSEYGPACASNGARHGYQRYVPRQNEGESTWLTHARTPRSPQVHPKAMSSEKIQWPDPRSRRLWLAPPRHSCLLCGFGLG